MPYFEVLWSLDSGFRKFCTQFIAGVIF